MINLNESWINYSFLKINGKIIACHIGYNYKNTFLYIFPAYDIEFKKYSPGNILLFKLLEFCKNSNLSYFDLTIGYENYKSKINNLCEDIYEVIDSNGLTGLVYKYLIIFKIVLKKIIIY